MRALPELSFASRLRSGPVLTAVGFVFGLFFAARGSLAASRTLDEIMAEATRAKESGDFERTLALLREAYAVHPAPELLNNIGRILEQVGRYLEAVDAYQAVLDDPKADPTLRAMDAGRLAALQRKVGRAWVVPKLSPEGATLLVNGEAWSSTEGREIELGPAVQAIEMRAPGAREVVLRFRAFPVGERTVLKETLDVVDASDCLMRLKIASEVVERVTINGYPLRADRREFDNLRVVAGAYEVEITMGGRDPWRTRIEAHPGAELMLEPPAEPVPHLGSLEPGNSARVARRAQGMGQEAPLDASPPASLGPPLSSPRAGFQAPTKDERSVPVIAWILGGSAVAAAGAGAFLFTQRSAFANDLEGFHVINDDNRGEYDTTRSKASTYGVLSTIAFGVAGSALVGAGVTWFLGD